MAVFENNMIMTNIGLELYTKVQAGAELHFTRMQVGSGQLTQGQDPQTFTALITPKHYFAISSVTPNTLQKITQVSGSISNTGITQAEYICELGLWAEDPDQGEILYAYANAGTKGDYFSPASQGAFTWDYEILAAVGNAASITAEIGQLMYDNDVISSDSTLAVIGGGTQKAINKNIDNTFKVYSTTHSGNAYSVAIAGLQTLTNGYPFRIKFDAASTGAITLKVNNFDAYNVVDYFNNNVTNVRNGLIANIVFDEDNGNFQLLGKGGGGNTIAAHVLLNDTCTVDVGPIIGTMPNRSGANTQAVSYDGTSHSQSIYILPQNGYHNGTNAYSYITDANYIASNILNNVSIFGLVGSATIQSLGGLQIVQGTTTCDSTGHISVSGLPFTPKLFKLSSYVDSDWVWMTWLDKTLFHIFSDNSQSYGEADNNHVVGTITNSYKSFLTNPSVSSGVFTVQLPLSSSITFPYIALG